MSVKLPCGPDIIFPNVDIYLIQRKSTKKVGTPGAIFLLLNPLVHSWLVTTHNRALQMVRPCPFPRIFTNPTTALQDPSINGILDSEFSNSLDTSRYWVRITWVQLPASFCPNPDSSIKVLSVHPLVLNIVN